MNSNDSEWTKMSTHLPLKDKKVIVYIPDLSVLSNLSNFFIPDIKEGEYISVYQGKKSYINRSDNKVTYDRWSNLEGEFATHWRYLSKKTYPKIKVIENDE